MLIFLPSALSEVNSAANKAVLLVPQFRLACLFVAFIYLFFPFQSTRSHWRITLAETPRATSEGFLSLLLRFEHCTEKVCGLFFPVTAFKFNEDNALLYFFQGNRDERETVDVSLAKQDAQVNFQ